MTASAIIQYISETYPEIQTVNSKGNTFFFYGEERNFPFATLVTKDDYDTVSNLSRPGIYRLSIGLTRETFLRLFPDAKSDAEPTSDYAALDQIMPHPAYGKMNWICVLSPSEPTFASVKTLLAEAYEMNVAKGEKRNAW